MNIKSLRLALFAVVLIGSLLVAVPFFTNVDATQSDKLTVKQENGEFVLGTDALGKFHRTARQTVAARLIQLPESSAKVVTWTEQDQAKGAVPFYAVSLDGKSVARVAEADYELLLRYKKFDPAQETPEIPQVFRAAERPDAASSINGKASYIVQFVTQPLDEYRRAVSEIGGKIYEYLPNHAYIVGLNEAEKANVESLPFVRYVGRYEPVYKLEEKVRESLLANNLAPARYNLMVLERGAVMQERLAQRIRAVGGKVDQTTPQGFRMEATLTANQLLEIAQDESVLFIDRRTEPSSDMSVVRDASGANFIEAALTFRGQGVRGEIMDFGFVRNHVDFNNNTAPLIHGPSVGADSHGTATYGILFGRGVGNPSARGLLPDAQGIFAGYQQLTNRYTHTAELKEIPYNAVFQSNSWGDAQTTAYDTKSAEMDDILFLNDILILNSQSNTGTQDSRPQAWAKNVVSVGGIRHQNTPSFDDDRWQTALPGTSSVGPAADGRIKPDLAHFNDGIFTTFTSTTNGYGEFDGTSAATPITAGHFGIFFQMWHHALFGNPTGSSVFESRPHMTTAKAMMINTAAQWNMAIPGTDITRTRQGWGRADLQNLYNLRQKMFIVNETDVLTNLQTKSYSVRVPQGSTDPFKVTMTYNDPKGNPGATRARINDLSLKVTAPDGTIYWGNNGLATGMWSTSGGSANTIDTVENVFIQTPQSGLWKIEVIASEVNADARTETPGQVDVDFALVASGIGVQRRTSFDYDGDGKSDVSVFRPSATTWFLQRSTAGYASVPFGAANDKLAPADYDGDGRTDYAVFRPNGQGDPTRSFFFILQSATGNLPRNEQFGSSGDIPVSGDFDGDGKADIAVYRGGATPGAQSYFFYRPSGSPGVDYRAVAWGTNGDKPVVGDFDADGIQDVGVFRPSNSAWYIQYSSNSQLFALQFGISTDKPVAADYDGDGKTDVAVFRDGVWYIQRSQRGFYAVQFGISTDLPLPADYDGDGKADIAVYRNGAWYFLTSADGFFSAVSFGTNGDVPTPTAFLP